MDEKIELVKVQRHRYGLNTCLRAVGLSKGTWHYRQRRRSGAERDVALKAEIVSVIEKHPGYGFRRIQAELKARLRRPINHKRLRRVLNQKDNLWIESFWGRFKTENAEVLLACDTESEVASVVEERLVYYNRARCHSALDYKRPMEILLSTLKAGNIAEES